jgi:hypothetical protein
MTNAQLLASYLREDEADCHWHDVRYEWSSLSARYVAILLEVAEFLDDVPDCDGRMMQMDRAKYFTSGLCVPGPKGWSFVENYYVGGFSGPEEFVSRLSDAAYLDDLAWKSGAVPPDRRHLGWNGTTDTHTAAFDVRWSGH